MMINDDDDHDDDDDDDDDDGELFFEGIKLKPRPPWLANEEKFSNHIG